MVPPSDADKPAWRAWARQRQHLLDAASLTGLLAARLCELPEFVAARHVLVYLAMPGEVRAEEVIPQAGDKQWYVPRCAPKRRLAVHPYTPSRTPLRPGPFGIREPDPEQVPEADPTVLDLVIVPGLVFSERGERIGYGGGYYDRFLPRTRADCIPIGLMPREMVVPELPTDPWDQPLGIVVTEERIFRPGSITP